MTTKVFVSYSFSSKNKQDCRSCKEQFFMLFSTKTWFASPPFQVFESLSRHWQVVFFKYIIAFFQEVILYPYHFVGIHMKFKRKENLTSETLFLVDLTIFGLAVKIIAISWKSINQLIIGLQMYLEGMYVPINKT